MSREPKERRRTARALTRLPLVVLDAGGAALDDRALAHDLSEAGFKVETQADLARDQAIGYRLELDTGGELRGRARVVWSRRTDLSNWAGAEFVGLTRADRRRVRRELKPSTLDWNALADKAILALGLILAVLLSAAALGTPARRDAVAAALPRAAAALAMVWSLAELLRPRG